MQERVRVRALAQLQVSAQAPMPVVVPARVEPGSFARREERSDLRFDLYSNPFFCCNRT